MNAASTLPGLHRAEQVSNGSVRIIPADIEYLRRPIDRNRSAKSIATSEPDDPMVVSDDNFDVPAYCNKPMFADATFSYLVRAALLDFDTDTVLTKFWSQGKKSRLKDDGWREFIASVISCMDQSVLQGINSGAKGYVWPDAALDAISARFFIDPIRCMQAVTEHGLHSAAAEYLAILDTCLAPLGYSVQEEYEDPLGGIVLDFLRGHDRMTCIISKPSIQILFCKEGELRSELFENSPSTKLLVPEFVEENIK